ncbi:MAG: hypothetical protein IOD15_11285 [Phycisphaerales bacterium]|nr:hypothetical protein [Phycisphaerales bacterium]
MDEAWRRPDGRLHPHPLLVRWAGAWWGYSEGHWSRLGEAGGDNEASLKAVVWHYLQASWRRMHRANGPDEVMPFHPGPDDVSAVVQALAVDTTLQGVEAAPAWLPTRVGDGGRPRWGLTATLAACAAGAATIRVQEHAAKRSEELGGLQAETVVSYLDGLVDVSRLRYGAKVAAARRPHTPDLFVTSVLPYAFPAEAAQRVLDAGSDLLAWWAVMEPELEALAPHFLRWLLSASGMAKALDGGTDEDVRHALEWIRQLAQMMGDTVDEDRSVEKIFVCQGPGRAGKGTIADCVELAVGVRNVAAMRLADWEDKFGLVTMIGRRAALFRDLHVGKNADTASMVELAKMVSGQDRMQIRDIYSKATANVRLRCRVWWFANVLPTSLRDQSTAFAGRLLVLPLRWGFQGREDPSIKAGIATEGQGVHLFALSGLAMLRNMGRRQIQVCADAEDARAEYEQSTSPTAAFVQQCCMVWPPSPAAIAELDLEQRSMLPMSPDGELDKAKWRMPFDELYSAYCGFCRAEGVTPAGKHRFSAEIRPLVPEWRHRADTGQGLPQARQPNGLVLRMAPGIVIRPGVRLGGDGAEPGQDRIAWG